MSPIAMLLLQNLSRTNTDRSYSALTVYSIPSKFTTSIKLLLKSATYYRNLQARSNPELTLQFGVHKVKYKKLVSGTEFQNSYYDETQNLAT